MLVADDNIINQKLLRRVFQTLGFPNVVTANDGKVGRCASKELSSLFTWCLRFFARVLYTGCD